MANPEEKNVIILGASPDRSRYSNKAVRCYREAGFTVYPVHPKETEVEGLAVSPRISDVPARAATLLLYVRPEIGMAVIDQAPGKGVRTVYLNPGSGSPELVEKVRSLGMEPIEACSIVAQGRSPSNFPD